MSAPVRPYHKSLFAAAAVLLIIGVAVIFVRTSVHLSSSNGDVASSKAMVLSGPEFVGRSVCAECHAEQDRLWRGSHHDLAMQEAASGTVLGNFDDTEFSKDGIVSRFFRRDGRFWMNTDGPDGRLADFEIKYAFGFFPLQQYLIELPGGRFQAISIAWDSRSIEEGGQRWFHLYPDESTVHTDELHWTKRAQNWNFMCAECHSTNLQKNYDPDTRSYHTVWSEIDVSCEACHGPASRHVAWVERKPGFERIDAETKGLIVQLDERLGSRWTIDPESGNAHRNVPRSVDKEVQVCARCHSRRAQFFADYRYGSLMDSHLPSLLQESLYHADGQIDGEVYEYGSFLQSKMYRYGVTCSDCHEPHSLKLRAEGNGVCLQCHAAEQFDNERHHFHELGAPGSRCVDCHMPAKTYMVVDVRHDHGFRIPRPDLSEQIGTPNACNACHSDQTSRWASDIVRQRYGHDPKGYQNFAETLHAAQSGANDTNARLTALLKDNNQPTIARATAVAELGTRLSSEMFLLLTEALNDPEPLLRSSALEALSQLTPEQRWPIAHQLLRDPVRTVRALAASALAGTSEQSIPSHERAEFRQAMNEYLSALRLNADDPAAQVNLGNFYSVRDETDSAERAYREALQLDSNWVPAYINLADLLRRIKRDGDGEKVLREGLNHAPKSAVLHHSLGLLQARNKNLTEALTSLKQAVDLDPGAPQFSYVYALALSSAGNNKEAREFVESALKRLPHDPSLILLNEHLSKE
ncbi:tetratricopeptide repeat protein [Methylotuvimicrobium sp.]|uniref:tetratricopeptide repeat protein n=1 Tax=Methylotuvimicrobium sp. TaxID=2822413 RepID=UPI003D65F9D8